MRIFCIGSRWEFQSATIALYITEIQQIMDEELWIPMIGEDDPTSLDPHDLGTPRDPRLAMTLSIIS